MNCTSMVLHWAVVGRREQSGIHRKPAEIEELASRARRGVVIVPSSDGAGTNALLRTPPDVIESRFGPGSFEAHWSQAQARGVPVEVARPAGLMFDIDTPEDVAELLVRAPDCRAARFLQCPSTS